MRHALLLIGVLALSFAAHAQQLPPPRDAQLTIVVKNEQGQPIAGATVVAAPAYGDAVNLPLSDPSHGVTDSEGRCSFASVPRMPHAIVVRTESLGAWSRAYFSETTTETVSVTLKRGIDREVTITDAEGKPLPGVTLLYWKALPVTQTDETGRAILRNLDPEEPAEIGFVKDGFGYLWQHYSAKLGKGEINLSDGALLEGTVKDPQGNPVPMTHLRAGLFRTYSDEQGRFRLGWLGLDEPAIKMYIHWQEDENVKYMPFEVEATPGVHPLDIVLRVPDTSREDGERVAVEGKVVMKDTGEPVAATVVFSHQDPAYWFRPSQQKTEPDGTFRIEGIRADSPLYLNVRPNRKTLYCTNGVIPVQLQTSKTVKGLVLTVEEGCAIAGRLLDPEGDGIPNMDITVEPKDGPSLLQRTNGTGGFIFPNLSEPGGQYTLNVLAGGLAIQRQVTAGAKGEITRVDIRLEEPLPAKK